MDWKSFQDQLPPYGQKILFIPSPRYGLTFATLASRVKTDHEGDHFSSFSQTYKIYTEEMWAPLEGPTQEQISKSSVFRD